MYAFSRWYRAFWLLPLLASASLHAAIPSSERQALLNIYNSTGGSAWIQNGGWNNGNGGNGAAGSECGDSNDPAWFGIVCDSSNSHVVVIYLVQNGLSGSLPDLSAFTQLQTLNVADNNFCGSSVNSSCSLGGSIPTLNVLTQLQSVSLEGNNFSGTIPSLTGLTQLQGFDAAQNNLSGDIPVLSGLTSLQGFNVSHNSLGDAIPSLTGLSNLQVFDVDNNALTGALPSLSGLSQLQTFYAFSNSLGGTLPSLSGLSNLAFFNVNNNQIGGTISSLAGLSALQNFQVDSNQISGTIPSLSGLGVLNVFDVGHNQFSGAMPSAPSPNNLAAGQSVLCPNSLTTSANSDWDTATGVSPWYSGCSSSTQTGVNQDQFGLTGSWYNPATSGQGMVIVTYPDNVGSGHGTLSAGWYTFDTSAAGGQRWYAIQGDVFSNQSTSSLGIFTAIGGNFAAAPKIGSTQVGTATLAFSDCTHGTLNYNFTNGGTGSIPLTRVDASLACAPGGTSLTPMLQTYPLSGAWYDPNTSGQGLYFDINPDQSLFFAGWYTYAPNGSTISGGASQRWYALQGTLAPTATSATGIDIMEVTGGTFNVGGGLTKTPVGTASVTFQDCNTVTLNYTFIGGTNAGLKGTINLVRLGPTPPSCSL